MIAPLAINSAEVPRKIKPPHAPVCCSGEMCALGVNTTGFCRVPLMTVRPLLVMFTAGSSPNRDRCTISVIESMTRSSLSPSGAEEPDRQTSSPIDQNTRPVGMAGKVAALR